jgi:hypothetical protein
LVDFGEEMDCEPSVEKTLTMILNVERDGEVVEDGELIWMGYARMILWQRRMRWLLFDLFEEGLDISLSIHKSSANAIDLPEFESRPPWATWKY